MMRGYEVDEMVSAHCREVSMETEEEASCASPAGGAAVKYDTGLVCEECGSDGEGGQLEYSDGRFYHFRKIPKDGRVYPMLCSGKLVPAKAKIGGGKI